MRLILSDDELKKANSYRFTHDQAGFIAARGILRIMLGKYHHTEPEKIKFRYGPYGKPEIAHSATNLGIINFSVSHSKDIALYAIVLNRKLGVDIEFISDCTPINEIAEQVFPALEIMLLKSCPEHKRRKRFFAS